VYCDLKVVSISSAGMKRAAVVDMLLQNEDIHQEYALNRQCCRVLRDQCVEFGVISYLGVRRLPENAAVMAGSGDVCIENRVIIE
jgi:hypothetical protein